MIKRIGIVAFIGLALLLILLLSGAYANDGIELVIKEFDDIEYPSNPDIGFRSISYQNKFLNKGVLRENDNSFFDLTFYTNTEKSIAIRNIDLSKWIPTIPNTIRTNDYLSKLAIVNQEWNRNQIAFAAGEFETDCENIVRVDLARNCLNSYLWELIVYTKENSKEVPYAHAWFNFPKTVYHDLFEEINKIPFKTFEAHLEQWENPESKVVNSTELRATIKNIPIDFKDISNKMYSLEGERAKKRKEIITPLNFSTMKSLQTDNTTFATFSAPGFYNKNDPRYTQLGRIFSLDTIILRKTFQKEMHKIYHEIELIFKDKEKSRITKMIIGGLDFEEIPILKESEVHKGWQNSMGFGNNTFYEKYEDRRITDSKQNPYYAYLTDENNKWLDNHAIGIDGPLLYFENSNKNKLQIWLLSFERHAFVGNYSLEW